MQDKAEYKAYQNANDSDDKEQQRCSRAFFAEVKKLSSDCSLPLLSGIRINSHNVRNAAAKVIRSTAMTESIPAKENNAVANMGVSIELSDCENERRAPVF